MAFDWQARLKTVPHEPGVYIMKDSEAQIVYIGKAKDLKRRVRQYFQKSGDDRPFVRRLPNLLEEIDIILTNTEREALLLEANLIREHQPRFNILLKEERRYLCIYLDTSHDFPRLQVIRRGFRDKRLKSHEKIFGPYFSGYTVRQTMQLIDRHFHLRTCEDRAMRNRTRPCLEYQIKRCDAPCCLPVPPENYQRHVQDVMLFLDGKHEELEQELTEKMWAAAEKHSYEVAGRYRDQIAAVRTLQEQKNAVEEKDRLDRDIFGLYREGELVEIQLITMRRGVLSGGRSFSFPEQIMEDEEILERFVSAYYLREGVDVPHEILVPWDFEGLEELQVILTERRQRRVVIRIPQRGDGKRLIEMADKNAEQSFLEKQRTDETAQERLVMLQKRLGLSRIPYRIECIDNSHMQGRFPVSAIVVFEGGFPNRSAYRRYHIKEAKSGDDFAAMKEILTRRFRRGKAQGGLPDLMVVDGGRGQLQMALAAMEDLDLDGVDVVAIAKKRVEHDSQGNRTSKATKEEDRIILPGRKNSIGINHKRRELVLLSQLRDEAHKTAVTFHQKTRDKAQLHSILDDIPSVGPARKKALLKHIGSVKKIREASLEALKKVPGISPTTAETIKMFLEENG